MIHTPNIITTADQQYAALHLTVARNEIQKIMGPSLREVYAEVAAQGLSPAGPWFTHHLQRPNPVFDFEVCVPISTKIENRGRIEAKVWTAMTVARTELCGNYTGLAAAWGELAAWTEKQGLKTAADLWEVYTMGPESSDDPADWRTEMNWQVLA
jgi:effector-binding domain-containing protein